MQVIKRRDGWWITGTEPYYADGEGPFTEYGPYETKQEAESAMRAVTRFYTLAK